MATQHSGARGPEPLETGNIKRRNNPTTNKCQATLVFGLVEEEQQQSESEHPGSQWLFMQRFPPRLHMATVGIADHRAEGAGPQTTPNRTYSHNRISGKLIHNTTHLTAPSSFSTTTTRKTNTTPPLRV